MTVMELAAKLMIFIAVGFVARKLKVMPDGFDKMLTRFVLAIPIPCMIINSFNIEYSPDLLMSSPMLLGLSLASCGVLYIIVHITTVKLSDDVRRPSRFALMFTNFNFMGLPVVTELYGAKGAFYYVIFTLPFRIIFYGGAPLMLGKQGRKLDVKETLSKFLCEPVVGAFIGFALYALRIPVPGLVRSVLESLGGMASPLGLILCGAILANADWKGVMRHSSVFVVAFLRLLVVPAVMITGFSLMGLDDEIVRSISICFAMPVASLLPTFQLRYDPEAEESRIIGGSMVVISTLFSIATIPLWSLILHHFFP